MSKTYDYEKAKTLIAANQETLKRALLGMHEDWFWTAVTVWEDGEFTEPLNDGDRLAGINGSNWATPTLCLEFKDENEKHVPCFKGESSGEPPPMMLGCLSAPVQESLPPLTEED